ncbi:hypothetical protein LIER_03900 [Lithospermum erythrorhizon]|uniref:Uncharacterized protein n=1 Tax=Lithospermum erythrorhizon TaxID=34254 RepID=A0AAV3NWA2_LITER
MSKRMKIEQAIGVMDEEEKMAIDDERTMKHDILYNALQSHKDNLAYAMRSMARDEFQEEEYRWLAYMVFQGLSTRELEQLRDDVKFDLAYILRAESTAGIASQFFEAVPAVCEGELFEESGDLNAIKHYAQTKRKLQSSSYSDLHHLRREIKFLCIQGRINISINLYNSSRQRLFSRKIMAWQKINDPG